MAPTVLVITLAAAVQLEVGVVASSFCRDPQDGETSSFFLFFVFNQFVDSYILLFFIYFYIIYIIASWISAIIVRIYRFLVSRVRSILESDRQPVFDMMFAEGENVDDNALAFIGHFFDYDSEEYELSRYYIKGPVFFQCEMVEIFVSSTFTPCRLDRHVTYQFASLNTWVSGRKAPFQHSEQILSSTTK